MLHLLVASTALKTGWAIVAGASGAVLKAPGVLRSLKRWDANRNRVQQAKVFKEMRRYRGFAANPSALTAETLRDGAMFVMMLIAFLATFVVAASPPHTGWGNGSTAVLVVESFCMLGAAIYSLQRLSDRLNKARNPHRTRLLQEVKLMRLRLQEAETRIRKVDVPLLEQEAMSLRSLSKRLPPWREDVAG